MVDVGDIYTVEIFFEDFPDQSKLRPVLIIDVEDNLYLFAEITSAPPKNAPTYHDRFKEPIYAWKAAGLLNPSFVKTHKLHRAEEDKLLIYRGKIEGDELNTILNRIIEVNFL